MKLTFILAAALLPGLLLAGCSKEDPKSYGKVDYNKDGKIVFEELIVVFPDLTVDEFLAADADHNGVLDEKEYTRFRQARDAGKKLDASSPPLAPAGGEPAKPTEQSKPAEPAKTPEKAPEPAKPAESAPPAAPQTPAASPQAAVAPAPSAPEPAAEAVETVVAEPAPAPAPPAAAATSYTVGRGDNLSRIAKKFGITTKELMAANGIKDADRVDAGRVLTIPAPAQDGAAGPAAASDAVKPEVAAFVADYFAKSSAADAAALGALYGKTVDYYKKGKTGADEVLKDKTAYFQRWPERSYKHGVPTVKALSGGDLKVAIPVDYVVKRADKSARGKATFTLLLRPSGGSYRIIGEQSAVERK